MTINKNLYFDIVDSETGGAAAAALVNDNKRAVNEVVDYINSFDNERGTGALANVGTASDEIPTNADLGTASQADLATLTQTLAGTAGVLPDAGQVRKNHVAQVATIADLRNLEPAFDGQAVNLSGYHDLPEPLGGGIFIAKFGDYSAEVALDTLTGVYVAFPSDPTGSSGAWVRQVENSLTPEMFGAMKGVDCTASVQCAIDVSPNDFELIYRSGFEYIQGSVSLSGKSRAVITGYGAKIKGPSSRVSGYFNASGCDNTVLRGFEIDHMFGELPQYTVSDYPTEYNVAVYGNGAGYIHVYDCVFRNLYNRCVSVVNFQSATVRDCEFYSPQQNQDQILDYVGFSTGQRVSVYNNDFVSAEPSSSAFGTCGVFCAGITESATVKDNVFYNCGRDNTGTHRLAVIDFYFDCKRVVVENNKSYNGFAQFMRVSGCESGSIKCNEHYTSGAAESGYTMLSIEGYSIGAAGRGNKDIKVHENKLVDEFNRHEICVGVFAYDWGLPSENVSIYKNTIVGAKYAVNVIGPCSDIYVQSNEISDYLGLISLQITSAQPITSDKGTEGNSVFGGIHITKNTINTSPSGASAITVTSDKTPEYLGIVGVLCVDDNQIARAGGSSGYGISVNAKKASTRSASSFIRNNRIRGVSTAIYPRECSYLAIFNNDCASSSEAITETDNDIIERQKNKRSGSQTQGVATLSAGVVTVSTPEIRSGDQVLVIRTQSAGSIGFLYISSITNGSSFTISSTNASDASKVFWEILY